MNHCANCHMIESECICQTQKVSGLRDEKLLDGKFKILEMLGTGAAGSVYLAEHVFLQKRVAIKVLNHALSKDQLLCARMQREATICANFQHNHVVGVLDFGVDSSGAPYMVQDYIGGRDLKTLLDKQGVLSSEQALKLFTQLTSALECLHQHRIIHRDIKPQNIIVSNESDGSYKAWLIDLGIAKTDNPGGALQHLTQTGSVFGTPTYMSPEQCKGLPIDARSDLYSLGCVMYEAISGTPPFRGASMMETLGMHISDPPPPIAASFTSDTSKALHEAIFKCLQKSPGDRFGSATQLLTALNKTRENASNRASALRTGELQSAPPRNLQIAQIAVTAILSIALGGFLGAYWQKNNSPTLLSAYLALAKIQYLTHCRLDNQASADLVTLAQMPELPIPVSCNNLVCSLSTVDLHGGVDPITRKNALDACKSIERRLSQHASSEKSAELGGAPLLYVQMSELKSTDPTALDERLQLLNTGIDLAKRDGSKWTLPWLFRERACVFFEKQQFDKSESDFNIAIKKFESFTINGRTDRDLLGRYARPEFFGPLYGSTTGLINSLKQQKKFGDALDAAKSLSSELRQEHLRVPAELSNP